MGNKVSVIGGARSGKSAFAEQLALQEFKKKTTENKNLFYLATAQAFDEEMQTKILLHQKRRSSIWQTIDAPVELSKEVLACSQKDNVILIDCLSMWTTNLLIKNANIKKERQALVENITSSMATIIIVSCETGLGIVPDTPLSRKFRDENGDTNQIIAHLANEMYFMIAGVPQKIKP